MVLRFIILLSFTSQFFLYAQNIDLYITLLEKGKINDVRENLPELLERYPNEAGVFFLKALTASNGDEAISIYEKLISDYPNSDYSPLSEMKIGEYLFARGLYSQASIQFKKIIINYSKGDHHQRALDLMVNSYLATGENDSVKIALVNIKNFYPSLDYNKYGISGLDPVTREAKLVRLDPGKISDKFRNAKEKRKKSKIITKPWVVQVGAFGKYNNAQRLKKQLQGNGFPTEVHTINSNGKRLHAVRLVRYQEKIDAEKIGKKIKKKYGLDFRVIFNPK